MLGSCVLFMALSLIISLVSIGDHTEGLDRYFIAMTLIVSAFSFCVGLTEGILWAAHPVQDQCEE